MLEPFCPLPYRCAEALRLRAVGFALAVGLLGYGLFGYGVAPQAPRIHQGKAKDVDLLGSGG